MSTSSRRLAEDIYNIERLARGHATTPQMEATSVGRVDFHDGDGEPQGNIRPDRDGGLRIEWGDGPQPPPPSTPTVTSDMGLVRVRWNGMFGDPLDSGVPVDPSVLATHDIHVVEIHLSMDPLAEPDRVETFAGTFDATAGGGDATVGPLGEAGEYWCFLVSRSRSGKRSNPSGRVAIQVTVNSMESELLGLALRAEEAMDSADNQNKVYYGDAPPEPKPRLDEDGNPMFDSDGNELFYPFKDGDMWFGEGNMPHVYSGDTGEWVSAADERVDAIQSAVEDLESALDDVVVGAGGTKNFYQADPPAADGDPAPAEGDLWFDQNDQNKPYIFRDGEWVSVRDDSFLSTAKNLMPWGATGDPHALAGQTFTIPSAEMRVQAGVLPGLPTLEGLGILIGDGENHPTSRAITRLPFQGAFDASNSLRHDSTAIPYEGRPLGVSALMLFNSSSGTPVARVYATFYDVEGNALRSESASANARPLDPDDPQEGTYLSFYGMTHIVALERVLELQESLRADAVSFAMHVELSIPRVAGSAAAILTLEARVQVPEGGIAANAITETKIAPNSIATPHLQAEVVTAEKIAAGTITAESGIIGSLDAGKITVGEMDGVRIKAGTVDAGKLRVGSESNFLPAGVIASESDLELWPGDPSFRDGGGSARGGAAVYPRGHGPVQFDSMGSFSVTPGDIIAFEMWAASVYEDSMMYAEVRDQDGNTLGGWEALYGLEFVGDTSYPVSAEVVGGGWRGFGAKTTVPSGVNRIHLARIYLNHPDGPSQNGEVWLSGLRLYRLTGSTLIADGAITTDKIATGAITAESGIIGSLDAGVITTGELRGELIRAQSIAAEALAADAIDGKTITGATIRTASSGTRVEITGSGLRQYNSNSQVVTEMAAGRFSAVGSFVTGFDGERRIEVSNEVWGNGAGMMFVPSAKTVSPSMKQYESRLGSPAQGHVEMASAESPGGTRARIMLREWDGVDLVSRKLSSGGYSETGAFGRMMLDHRSGVVLGTGQSGNSWGEYIALLHSDAPTNHWTGGEPGGVRISSSIVDVNASKGFKLRSNDGIQLTSFSSQQQKFIRFWDESGDGWSTMRGEIGESSSRLRVDGKQGLDLLGYGSDLRLDYDGRSVVSSQAILHRTASNSGNVYMNTAGVFFRGTSARKYKVDERSIPVEEYADALLSIDFKAWRDRAEVEGAERLREWRDERPMQPVPYDLSAFTDEPAEYVGAVADDFHDAGLGSLVEYDEYGQVEGLMYERIGPALIPIIRDLRDRINELEERMRGN